MNNQRYGVAGVVDAKILYAIGGSTAGYSYSGALDTIEMYDTTDASNKWILLSSLMKTPDTSPFGQNAFDSSTFIPSVPST